LNQLGWRFIKSGAVESGQRLPLGRDRAAIRYFMLSLNLADSRQSFTTLETLMPFKTASTLSLIACLGFSALAMASSDKETEALAVPKANFAVADADANGELNQDEFIVFIDANADADFGKAAKIKKRNAYDRAFSKIDADGNDSVSWEEFAAQQ